MKTISFIFHLVLFFLLENTANCIAQNPLAVQFAATPESYPNAMDGKIVATVATAQYPPPYTFRIKQGNNESIEHQNTTGVHVFTGLGYGYYDYCITVIMGDGCYAYGCFQFDEPCASEACLIADFNIVYTPDGCTIQFDDWSQGNATSWDWDFGDGSSSNLQNPSHIYSASGCYNVTLHATKNALTREVSKEVCITSCVDGNTPEPECQINAPSAAAAGQTINLSVVGTGIGPFVYDWTTPAFINPLPSNITPFISALIPNTANNGDQYNFTAQLLDNNGHSTSCTHTVTVGGNPPDVKVSAFGSFEPNQPLVLVAFVDLFNLIGLEEYYFTIKKDGVEQPGDCLNTWQPYYDCTLTNGLPQGYYQVCVRVRDDAGIYENCIDVNINSTPPPPSPEMWLEVKAPANPKTDPTTHHYILEAGSTFRIGINGNHPHSVHPLPCTQKEYYVILHCKNLTTGQTFDIGSPVGIDPKMNSMENGVPGVGLNWYYEMGQGCTNGTLSITADVFNIRCDEFAFPPDIDHDPTILYKITQPLLIDLYPKKPTINAISIDNDACDFPINVNVTSSCNIASYEWHAYDSYSNEEIVDFFSGNTNAATVYPNLNHNRYLSILSGGVVRFRCNVTVVDVNGFTSEYSDLMMMRVPFRVDIPATIYRCPESWSHFSDMSIAMGGDNRYEYEWSVVQPIGGSLDFASNDPHDPNPLFQMPASGSKKYHLVIKNLNHYQQVLCQVEKDITVTASTILLDLPNITWPICSTGGREIGPTAPINLNGSGHYTFLWSTANTANLAYLSDVNVSNPLISGVPVGQTITYTLTATDIYGGCTSSDNITIISVANNHTVELTGDESICYGEKSVLTANGLPIESSPPFGNLFNQYHWTTTNAHHNLSGIGLYAQQVPIDEITSSYPGTYTYTVRYQNLITGCYAEASKNVTIRDSWEHNGYVPYVRTAIIGSKVPVWQAYSANNITKGVIVQNPGCNANVSWAPHIPTDITLNSGSLSCVRIPINGMFIPTIAHPFTVMKVSNGNGCSKSYKSQRYILVEAKPEIWVNADKSVVCKDGEMCFDVTFDMHVANYQSAWLPPTVLAKCTIDPPVGMNKEVELDLVLVNNQGLYKGHFCENKFFKNASQTPYKFGAVIKNASPIFFNPLEYEIDESSAEIQFFVSDQSSNPAQSMCTTPVGMFFSLDLGLPLPSNNPCPLGTTMFTGYLKVVSAGSYIEIHPDVGIEIYPVDPGEGHRFVINPCIQHQGPEQKPEELTNIQLPATRDEGVYDATNILEASIEVFPNPFTSEISIKYTIPSNCTETVSINLLDITGKLLRIIEKRVSATGGKFEIIFDGEYLAPGVYFYELLGGNCHKVKRAVKIGF